MISFTPSLLGFSANGNTEFRDTHLQHLQKNCAQLKSLDLRQTKITSAEMIDFLSTHCGNQCARCDGDQTSLHTKRLRRLNVSDKPSMDDSVLKCIGERCPELHELDLGQLRTYRFTDQGIQQMVQGPISNSLRKLILAGCDSLTDDSVLAIADTCRELAYFDCKGAFLIGNRGISSLLANCPIIFLDASYCWRLSDELFCPVGTNPEFAHSLVELIIRFCYQLSDNSLLLLEHLPNLKKLDICNVDGVTVRGVTRLHQKQVIVLHEASQP
jgi:hypothetical protein